VLIMAEDGRVLAHERALGYDDGDPLIGEECSLIYHASGPGLVFYIRTNKDPTSRELPGRIEAILASPSPVVTA